MNTKVSKHIYNLATMLFVIGGILLYQGNEKGAWAIAAALLIHAGFRFINLSVENLKRLIFLDILKLVNACFLTVVTILLFFNIEAIPYIATAILFDLLLNIPIMGTKKDKI